MAAESLQQGNTKSLAVPALYSALVISLVILRLQSADEELSSSAQGAQAVVLTAITIGPAWLIELLLRAYWPARLLGRRIRLLRHRIRAAERARRRAARHVAQISRQAERWDQEAARLRAVYQVEHRLKSAEPSPGELTTTTPQEE
jgi:hypothetical protein